MYIFHVNSSQSHCKPVRHECHECGDFNRQLQTALVLSQFDDDNWFNNYYLTSSTQHLTMNTGLTLIMDPIRIVQILTVSVLGVTAVWKLLHIIFHSFMQISSQAIQNYVSGKIRQLRLNRNGYWIGAHDRHGEGRYMWDSGIDQYSLQICCEHQLSNCFMNPVIHTTKNSIPLNILQILQTQKTIYSYRFTEFRG